MTYGNYYPQYPPQYPTQASPTRSDPGMIWVQGEAAAKSFLVAPNSSVFLMDSEKSVFYIKSTDASGMPLPLRIFDYTERTQNATTPAAAPLDNYITREEFEKRLSELTPAKGKKVKDDE